MRALRAVPKIPILPCKVETGACIDRVIDWRWLTSDADLDEAFASERSLIHWLTWARPKKPGHA